MSVGRALYLMVILGLTPALGAATCDPVDVEGPSGGEVSGMIGGRDFVTYSGSAERLGGAGYLVTLADGPGFGCEVTSGPGQDYLSVVIGELQGAGTYAAAEVVTFNVVEAGVVSPEAASGGQVIVDRVDETPGAGVLEGTLEASGPTSDVAGSFSVTICE